MAPFLPYLTDHIHRALCDGDERASAGLAGRVGLCGRCRPGRAHGSGARGLLGGGFDPHGQEPAQPPAARDADHRASAARDPVEPLRDVIAEEANVKEVAFADDPSTVRRRGAGGQSARCRQAARPGDEGRAGRRRRPAQWTQPRRTARSTSPASASRPDEYELRFQPKEGIDAAPFDGNAGVVVLDTERDAGAGARGPGARLHPPGPGGAQGRRLQRLRPHRHRGEGGAGRRRTPSTRIATRCKPRRWPSRSTSPTRRPARCRRASSATSRSRSASASRVSGTREKAVGRMLLRFAHPASRRAGKDGVLCP